MAHPKMFDDDDPRLARVRALAGASRAPCEKVSHGRPPSTRRRCSLVLRRLRSSRKVCGPAPHRLTVLPDESDRPRPARGPAGLRTPPTSARQAGSGWDLDGSTDWDEVAELLDASYRLTAPRRPIAGSSTGGAEPEDSGLGVRGTAATRMCRCRIDGRRAPAPEGERDWILHVDLDQFLAAVEVLRRPELAGRRSSSAATATRRGRARWWRPRPTRHGRSGCARGCRCAPRRAGAPTPCSSPRTIPPTTRRRRG